MRSALVCWPLLALMAGCAGPRHAPVSGTVTLNGKPLAGANVSFQPMALPGKAEASGPGSAGKTDQNGHYTLRLDAKTEGAIIGKHQIRIELVQEGAAGDGPPPRGGWPKVSRIPARYNIDSKETFEVPATGTDKADFALTSP